MTILIAISTRIDKGINELSPTPLYSLQPMWLWAFCFDSQIVYCTNQLHLVIRVFHDKVSQRMAVVREYSYVHSLQ